MTNPPIHGLMAEFTSADEILAAVRSARLHGYRAMEAYSPYSVDGLPEELGMRHTHVPFVVFMAGLIGAAVGFFMMWYSMAIDYPFDVGGRPLNSWPVFIPITFEVMILVSALSALLGMLFLNGLPRLYRPVFNVPRFDQATQDRFFLCIEATDELFDLDKTKEFLLALKPAEVVEVPH